jgi:G3E family GTPase
MKILLVAGFLGAGKTTFIRHLAGRTHRRFVVLENEYGEVGIDADLLTGGEAGFFEKNDIWELTEGCICCSMKGDFTASVLTIANVLDPEILVVEPTGIGLLSNLVKNLQQIQYERIVLLQPVTLIDSRALENCLAKHGQIIRDQIRSASRVILTKTESLSDKERHEKALLLKRINPKAMVESTPYTEKSKNWWHALFNACLDPSFAPLMREIRIPDFENAGLRGIRLPSANHLVLFLQAVVSGVFGYIYRAKGAVAAGPAFLRFDVVDGGYSITCSDAAACGKAVFIGKNLRRDMLKNVFLTGNHEPRHFGEAASKRA